MTIQFNGCGLPNVSLQGGYRAMQTPEGTAHSYADLDGLYVCIARAIALSTCALSADEFRFLRKRLGWSQEQAGELVGKTAQAVAKWEKAVTPIPKPDASMLRMAWVNAFSSADAQVAIRAAMSASSGEAPGYEFRFQNGKWCQVETDRKETAKDVKQPSLREHAPSYRGAATLARPVLGAAELAGKTRSRSVAKTKPRQPAARKPRQSR